MIITATAPAMAGIGNGNMKIMAMYATVEKLVSPLMRSGKVIPISRARLTDVRMMVVTITSRVSSGETVTLDTLAKMTAASATVRTYTWRMLSSARPPSIIIILGEGAVTVPNLAKNIECY
ncbi:MAG TPA: hypothetical protein VHG52_05710 [Thermomicrobiales bacterium]|nr:hypothetical protein [Thermomicrobiales bacterium]